MSNYRVYRRLTYRHPLLLAPCFQWIATRTEFLRTTPRLLAAFGSRRDRYGTAAEMQQYSGIAPVQERSGKMKWVHFRWACPKFLRQTFHEWASHSIGFCGWARAYYEQQLKAGKRHHAAVRALAFKWIRIAFRCWKDGVPYDDERYIASLRQRGSPLAQAISQP